MNYDPGSIKLGYGEIKEDQTVSLPENLFERFPTEIKQFQIPEDPLMLHRVLTIWEVMMHRKFGWDESIPDSPYIIDLFDNSPNWFVPVSYMPKVMVLGGYRMLRLMDAFYAPDKQGAQWAERLFDYLAPRYEKIVDLKLKASIDLLLLANTSGYVLDVGCGTGLAQNWINQFYAEDAGLFKLFGIDISARMLEIATTTRGEKTMKGNIAELTPSQIRKGFRKNDRSVNFFDHAIMSYVDNWTTHEERVKIFGTVHSLLKRGSTFRLNVYNVSDPNWLEYYKKILLRAGFRDVKSTENKLPARDGYRDVGFVFAYK